MSIEIIYRVERPFAEGTIEVYGESDMGWYEWRILSRGEILADSGNAGYGSATIALRDGINADLEGTE